MRNRGQANVLVLGAEASLITRFAGLARRAILAGKATLSRTDRRM
jgi:hypothetical protein